MNDGDLERVVFDYLESRASEPSLSPEAFAARRPELGPEAIEAMRSALDLERMFPEEAESPRRIGGYAITGEIARGGMGIVYRAEREGRAFALKLLPLAPVIGPRMLERFRREAGTLEQLSHPGIVRVHETGMHGDVPFLVMDLVDGQPLHRLGPTLSRDEAVQLIETLAEAVAAAHGRGILHRDLKPQNVMVGRDGRPVLLDFGLSADEELPTITATDEILGTPRYMAPEQLAGGPVDARTDVYAIGLMLFELVARRPARDQRNRDAMLHAVRFGRVPRPRTVDDSIPVELERIILTALALDPERRYPDAAALADDLARFRRGEPVTARPPGFVTRIVEAVRSGSRAFPPPSGAPRTDGADHSPAARGQAARHRERGIARWLDGDPEGARAEVGQALALDPGDATARALAAHLSGRPTDGAIPGASDMLRLAESGAYGEASGRLGVDADAWSGTFVSAIRGLAAAGRGDWDAALADLDRAARDLEGSARIQRAFAEACVHAGRLEDGAAALRRALEIDPASAATWADLAELCLRRRDLDEGLKAIDTAASLSSPDDRRITRLRATLEVHAGRPAGAQEALERLVASDPGDVASRFELANALDSQHDIVGAAREYGRVLDAEPDHVRALIALAYLHSGASRGQCRSCDQVYETHPEYLDLDRAEDYLLRCLEADRGRSESATHNAREIALRLERRDRVIDLLERLTGSDTSTASLRLKDVVRRLRLTG